MPTIARQESSAGRSGARGVRPRAPRQVRVVVSCSINAGSPLSAMAVQTTEAIAAMAPAAIGSQNEGRRARMRAIDPTAAITQITICTIEPMRMSPGISGPGV